jgi:hypothetical protein
LLACAALLVLTAVGGCAGCDSDDAVPPTTSGSGSGGGAGGSPDLGPPASPKAIVRFKGAARLKLELSRALDLEPAEVCRELGRYDCFDLVHRVVLGDPDAFFSGVYEPLEDTTTTTPLAVDRVVLAACAERARRDLQESDPLIFGGLALDGSAIADIEAAAVGEAIDRLHQRALGRRAKPAEIDHHRQLYTAIVAKGSSQAPAQDWATLSCFSTLTTMEMLFF